MTEFIGNPHVGRIIERHGDKMATVQLLRGVINEWPNKIMDISKCSATDFGGVLAQYEKHVSSVQSDFDEYIQSLTGSEEFVHVYFWSGVVLEKFTSPKGNQAWLIKFAKNIFKGQNPELIPVWQVQIFNPEDVGESSLAEFVEEFKFMVGDKRKKVLEMNQ